MRSIIAGRCGLVDAVNHCRCDRQIDASLQAGILRRSALQFATHPGVTGPIEIGVLRSAAAQLDQAESIAELYRTAPESSAPGAVWQALRRAAPALLT